MTVRVAHGVIALRCGDIRMASGMKRRSSARRRGSMSYASQMLGTYSGAFSADADLLAATIDALSDCAQACTADTDADLSEQHVTEMIKCIRLCLNCVDVCTATA